MTFKVGVDAFVVEGNQPADGKQLAGWEGVHPSQVLVYRLRPGPP
jgi:hypothetical protein